MTDASGLHHAVTATERACTEIHRRMLTHRATHPRPRSTPELSRRSNTVPDPTGAQVASVLADASQAALRLADLLKDAVAVRHQLALECPDVGRWIVALSAGPDHRLDPSSPHWRRAVAVACRVVSDTPRLARSWWATRQPRHVGKHGDQLAAHDLESASGAVHLADQAQRLAAWLRPHERRPDLNAIAPGARWCRCDSPTCERVTWPGDGAVHPTCRKQRSRLAS